MNLKLYMVEPLNHDEFFTYRQVWHQKRLSLARRVKYVLT